MVGITSIAFSASTVSRLCSVTAEVKMRSASDRIHGNRHEMEEQAKAGKQEPEALGQDGAEGKFHADRILTSLRFLARV